ncbi:MAG: iron chaperone [Erysipelotrichaceae bacterium]
MSEVEQYYAIQNDVALETLNTIRSAILEVIPGAKETISYGLVSFVVQGRNIVYIGAFKKHLGFYPHNEPIVIFAEQLKPYRTSKGAIQFPYGKPLPIALIQEITRYRVEEEMEQLKHKRRG